MVKEIVLTQGQKYNLLDYATATDKEDGDITKNIKVVEDDIKINTPGEYKVVYEVLDKDGAKATKEVTVTVKAKENVPSENEPADKPSDKPMNKPTESPQTGDTSVMLYLGGIIASLIGLIFINRKK